VIEVRPLADDDVATVDATLPLHRLGQPRSDYLVAWDDGVAVGHACVEWAEKAELGDLWVPAARRGEGIGTLLVAAVERAAAGRGYDRVVLAVGADNDRAIRLYERLGYRRTEAPPRRVKGTITIRDVPVYVDDTLLEFAKPVDSEAARSSST
jgi:ribosomal protein S18 acetylase RimI-like enzyme